MSKNILVVDDELDMLQLLKRSLEKDISCRIIVASSGEMALEHLKQKAIDLVLSDIKMAGISGMDLLQQIKSIHPHLTVIMMTAFGDIDMAVEAMKKGAYDFITKPFDHDALVLRLEKALERSHLVKENIRLQRECRESNAFENMVGKSDIMHRVFDTLQMVASTEMTVLITGESGTGKELAARAIHSLSPRESGSFVAVNCPTIPEHILESELFGYKKGAFTHATQNKIGLFQEAHGGTIFLDEIGDIGPAVQAKLLRVIQEKEIKPLGDTRSISVDVRIIASTNQKLEEKIQEGLFREDLFYRLNVLPISLPPLKDRQADIPLLANHFLEKHCAKLDKPLKTISPELMATFMNRSWEGNIRELENTIVRGILFSKNEEIECRDVGMTRECHQPHSFEEIPLSTSYKEAKEELLQRFNATYIGNLLSQCQGNVTQAAKMCGMERQSLQQIMRRYSIDPKEYRTHGNR